MRAAPPSTSIPRALRWLATGALLLACAYPYAQGPLRTSTPEPITGAFGVRFGIPVPGPVLIGPTTAPAIAVNAALARTQPPVRAGVPPRWRTIAPPTIPPLLKDRPTPAVYGALLDDTGAPVRIVASVPADDCMLLYVRIAAVLEQRYGAPADPDNITPDAALEQPDVSTEARAPAQKPVTALVVRAPQKAHKGEHRAPTGRSTALAPVATPTLVAGSQSALYVSDGNQVQLTCRGQHLYLDYLDGVSYPAWQHSQRDKIALFDRNTRLALVARIAPAKNNVLEGAFGVRFGVPLTLPGALPDILAQFRPPKPFTDWPEATYEVMLDPTHLPIRIAGRQFMRDSVATFAEKARIVAALTERYGSPIKNSPRHTVIVSAGRLAVVDAAPNNEVLVMFVDSERLQRQHIRFEMRRAELAAQSERQRATEQAGF